MRIVARAILLAGSVAAITVVSAQDPQPRTWNFDAEKAGTLPAGFAAATGEWKIARHAAAPSASHTLAQWAKNERPVFNVVLLNDTAYQDLDLSVRMLSMDGQIDQGGVLIREYQLQDAALDRLARIVHGADIKGEEHAAVEAPGLRAIAEGFAALGTSDEQRLERGFPIYDALYAWCQKQASSEVKT